MPVNFSQSTRADGYVVDEDDWADLVDTINFLGNKPSVRVEGTTNTTCASGAIAAVKFGTERHDTDSMWSSTANTRIDINTPGKYLVGGAVTWTDSTAGTFRQLLVRLNGGSTFLSEVLVQPPETGNIGPRQSITTLTPTLTSTNYLQLAISHDVSAGLSVTDNTVSRMPNFWAIWQSS